MEKDARSSLLQMAKGAIQERVNYELIYNGDKKELYMDAYKKWENKCIPIK